jgi:hypothetical protein
MTYKDVLEMSSALQNDTAQSVYTNTAQLPYLKMALLELQERMQEANLPVTNAGSAEITITAGVTELSFGTVPKLPADFIEPRELWESNDGGNNFNRMGRRDFIPQYLEDTDGEISSFGIYAWQGNVIRFPPATTDIIVKLDYIKTIFPPSLVIGQITDFIPVLTAEQFLGYKTGALCAMFVGENEDRATALNDLAEEAIHRSLNIPTKGTQAMQTRRLPFRAGFKSRGVR